MPFNYRILFSALCKSGWLCCTHGSFNHYTLSSPGRLPTPTPTWKQGLHYLLCGSDFKKARQTSWKQQKCNLQKKTIQALLPKSFPTGRKKEFHFPPHTQNKCTVYLICSLSCSGNIQQSGDLMHWSQCMMYRNVSPLQYFFDGSYYLHDLPIAKGLCQPKFWNIPHLQQSSRNQGVIHCCKEKTNNMISYVKVPFVVYIF